MNIFRTYDDPYYSATALCDRHVVKMTLESAQILSTVCWTFADDDAAPSQLYRPTHANHPCVRLCVDSEEACTWLAAHALEIADEYRGRFGRDHKSEAVIFAAIDFLGLCASEWKPRAPSVRCVDEDLRGFETPIAYRLYLLRKWRGLERPPRWTGRPVPDWVARTGVGVWRPADGVL